MIQRSAEYIFVNNILCLCRFSWIKSPVSNYYSYYIRRFPFHLFDELPILSYYCNNTILKFHRTRTSSYSTISSSHRYGLIVFYTFVCIFSANNIIWITIFLEIILWIIYLRKDTVWVQLTAKHSRQRKRCKTNRVNSFFYHTFNRICGFISDEID